MTDIHIGLYTRIISGRYYLSRLCQRLSRRDWTRLSGKSSSPSPQSEGIWRQENAVTGYVHDQCLSRAWLKSFAPSMVLRTDLRRRESPSCPSFDCAQDRLRRASKVVVEWQTRKTWIPALRLRSGHAFGGMTEWKCKAGRSVGGRSAARSRGTQPNITGQRRGSRSIRVSWASSNQGSSIFVRS